MWNNSLRLVTYQYHCNETTAKYLLNNHKNRLMLIQTLVRVTVKIVNTSRNVKYSCYATNV